MKKRILLLICSIIIILLSSCAYQRYHGMNFRPPKSANGCKTHDTVKHGNYKKTMRTYYKLR